MSVFHYERTLGSEKTLNFDSHPRTTICSYFGYDPAKYEHKLRAQVGGKTMYDVYCGHRDPDDIETPTPNFKVGELTYTPPY